MKSNVFRIISFLIAILLIGALFYSGAFAQPSSEDVKPYGVSQHSTEEVSHTDEEPPQAWGNFDRLYTLLTKLAMLVPYAIFLTYRAVTSRTPKPTLSSLGYGAVLVVLSFAYPYILMFTEIPPATWPRKLLVWITWVVIVIEICRDIGLFQSKKA